MVKVFQSLASKDPKSLGELISYSGKKPWEVDSCPYCGSTDLGSTVRSEVRKRDGKHKEYVSQTCNSCHRLI